MIQDNLYKTEAISKSVSEHFKFLNGAFHLVLDGFGIHMNGGQLSGMIQDFILVYMDNAGNYNKLAEPFLSYIPTFKGTSCHKSRKGTDVVLSNKEELLVEGGKMIEDDDIIIEEDLDDDDVADDDGHAAFNHAVVYSLCDRAVMLMAKKGVVVGGKEVQAVIVILAQS
ncbi:hypothetical protein P691DRAFT_784856 [Macrolepiota fuliginosa MF-IS2]|uniref:Uncharacterized protein n=1 Tax=Macrolepiota fuliginosa MF-IS2 TaxID=1400762 RepID=A0A9P5WWU0_9AGAR|nr:hypothetical protein P691DRAFT_784856 [Macrolepiota fuliginosa MF-IS2]